MGRWGGGSEDPKLSFVDDEASLGKGASSKRWRTSHSCQRERYALVADHEGLMP